MQSFIAIAAFFMPCFKWFGVRPTVRLACRPYLNFCLMLMYTLQVVRCFEDENVIHVAGKVDPVEDTDVINFELALADITQIEKRLERIAKGRAKTKEETASNEVLSIHSTKCRLLLGVMHDAPDLQPQCLAY